MHQLQIVPIPIGTLDIRIGKETNTDRQETQKNADADNEGAPKQSEENGNTTKERR